MRYNTRQYNAQRYNINGVFHTTSLSETVTETDGTQLAEMFKSLSDSMSESDTIIFLTDLSLVDFVFADDAIQIQFTNKALADSVRLADWLSIERNPAQNGWFD